MPPTISRSAPVGAGRFATGVVGHGHIMRSGPLPLKLHAMVEPPVAIVFILAPFVLGFDDDIAQTLSVLAGILELGLFSTTRWRVAPLKVLSLGAHAVADFVTGAILVLAPFVFGFSDETSPTVFFVVMGVTLLAVTAATRFDPADPFAVDPVRAA